MIAFKKIRTLMINASVASATVLALSVQPAHAAVSGKTAVDFNFGGILILHYIPKITISFKGFEEALLEDATQDTFGEAFVDTIGIDTGIIVDATTVNNQEPPTKMRVSAKNTWALRGITTSGTAGMTADVAADTGVKGASKVKMTAVRPSTDKVTLAGFALDKAVKGGVQMEFDLSSVTLAGLHTGMVYSITATANP